MWVEHGVVLADVLRCSCRATVGWLGIMWALSLRHSWPKIPLLGSTILAVGLAWLPELLLMCVVVALKWHFQCQPVKCCFCCC